MTIALCYKRDTFVAHVQTLQLHGKLGVTRLKHSLADRLKQNLEKFTRAKAR